MKNRKKEEFVQIGDLRVLTVQLERLIEDLKAHLATADFAEDPSERDIVIDQITVLSTLH